MTMQLDSCLKISRAIPGDLDILSRLAVKCFNETYGGQFLKANVELYENLVFNVQAIEKELNDSHYAYFLASIENEVVGYVKLKMDTGATRYSDKHGFELQQIYLLKAFHKQMIGAFMMHHVIEYCKTHFGYFVWLGVWELNAGAIRFFNNWRFTMYSSRRVGLGSERLREILLKREL